MTDRETILSILDRAGVVYEEGGECVANPGGSTTVIEAKVGDKNLGYSGFLSYLYFDADGALLAVGAWE